jgi:hypothetical protein
MIDPARRIAGQRSESSGSLVLALRVAEQGRTASNQGAERKRDRSGKPEAKCDTVEEVGRSGRWNAGTNARRSVTDLKIEEWGGETGCRASG